MLPNKNYQFISQLEAQRIVEPLIPNINVENSVTAVELIKIPTGSVSFFKQRQQ